MKIRYDEQADVLYLTFVEGMAADLTIDNDSGDVIRYNSQSCVVVGITVVDFQSRVKGWSLDIPEVENGKLTPAGEALFSVFAKPPFDLLATR